MNFDFDIPHMGASSFSAPLNRDLFTNTRVMETNLNQEPTY